MHRLLVLTDFDQTVADTFRSGQDLYRQPIFGTLDAVAAAADRIFGEGTYDEIGGMQNRAPAEISRAISETPRWVDGCRSLGLTDEDPDLFLHVTKELNKAKLDILVEQIGRPLLHTNDVWPPHLPGFVNFVRRVNKFNDSNDHARIDWGIISSGHDSFINKTFETWLSHYGVSMVPAVTVTQDTLEHRHDTGALTRESRRSKPSPMPLALGIREWQQRLGNTDERGMVRPGKLQSAREALGRVMYTGDDAVRDGQMAHNADLVFGLMSPGEPFSLHPEEKRFVFGDWNDLATVFINRGHEVENGKPFDEMFFSRRVTHPESVYARRHGERR